MKLNKWILAGSLMILPFIVQASCESVKAEISQKIIANGVPESGFTLTILPEDQAGQSEGQVVGHCANDTQKIIYQRHRDETQSQQAVQEPAPEDNL